MVYYTVDDKKQWGMLLKNVCEGTEHVILSNNKSDFRLGGA
jgi:hypothetical protein